LIIWSWLVVVGVAEAVQVLMVVVARVVLEPEQTYQ
jgi:hypothetical protein